MKTKSIPPIHETHSLAYWNSGRVLLNISYDTDSVYLLVEGIPTIEFTYDSRVLDIRNPDKPRLIGNIRTPKGYAFGSALEFVSTQYALSTGLPSCTILYDDSHFEIFLRFEKELCKMLSINNYDKLNAFLSDWGEFKKLKPEHKSLTITFN